MALILNRDDKLKNDFTDFIGEDGIYRVTILENEDKIDDFDNSNKKGFHYHNLKIAFENGRTKFLKIYYMNAEGDIEPTGYNFLLSLRNILVKQYEDEGKSTDKIYSADSNRILGVFIKNKISIYLGFRQNKWQDNVYFNMNNFVLPSGNLRDAEAEAERRKLKVISLEKAEPLKEEDFEDFDEFEEDDL